MQERRGHPQVHGLQPHPTIKTRRPSIASTPTRSIPIFTSNGPVTSPSTEDAIGKMRKTYPHDQTMTPWERLESSPICQTHLKPGITDLSLEQQANAMSDNDAAKQVQKARNLLLQSRAQQCSLILRLENTRAAGLNCPLLRAIGWRRLPPFTSAELRRVETTHQEDR